MDAQKKIILFIISVCISISTSAQLPSNQYFTKEIPEKAKVTESKYENLLALFEKQQKTIEQLKKRNTKLQQNHQKSLNQTLSLIDEKMQLEEKITNLEMHIQHLTSNSKQKNYDKVIEMLENLKAKSNQQKIQITNLEAQLKKEREKKE